MRPALGLPLLKGSSMEIEFAVIADYAANTDEGKLIVAGIFDSIYAPQLPVHHPTLAVAMRLRAHPGEEGVHEVLVRIVDPDGGEVVPPMEAHVAFESMDPLEGGTAQMVMQVMGTPLAMTGRHSVDVLIDGRFEKSIPLVVRVAAAAGQG
jgi:hypothetical protein